MNNENIKFSLKDKCKNCEYIKPKPVYNYSYYQNAELRLVENGYNGWVVYCEHAKMCDYLERQTKERIENKHKIKLSKE
jgi:hypothetical protein